MERRDFLRTTSLATTALAMADFSVFGKEIKPNVQFTKLQGNWLLNDDGSFGYKAGSIGLEDCYPSFNGQPVFSKSVEVSRNAGGGEITYHLKNGKIKLIFTSDDDSCILKSILNVPVAPHWFYPISFAKVKGADRYFKQGIGFSGPSGIFDIPQTPVSRESHQSDESWSYDSYLTSGFFTKTNQALAIGSYKHDRFMQRSTYHNRPYRYGLVDRRLESDTLFFEAGFSTEELPLKDSLELPDLHFVAGTESFTTYRHYAENIAKENNVKFNNKPHYQVCTYWEFLTAYNQERLDDLIGGLKSLKPGLPIETIQIDGGFSHYGDWLIASENFPKGLENMTNTILNSGYKAGIWIGPFMVAANTKTYRDHPEWLLHDLDGNLHMEGNIDNVDCYILDTTNPQAFEYLRSVFRTYRKWGITYYKTDFMEWGLRDRTRFKRYDNSKTSVQHLTDVLKMIRQEIGPESLWLACIATYIPFIGFADAARISNDIPPDWKDTNHGNLIQEAFSMHYLQQVIWQNDPDCVFLRDIDSGLNSKLTRDEAYTLAYWDAIIGGYITCSDRFHKITPEYLKLWRFLQPGQKQMSCRFPYWSGNKKLKVAVRDYADGSAALLIVNPSSEIIKEEYSVKDLIGVDDAWFFGWKPGASNSEGLKKIVSVELKSHQSALFYINKVNKAPAKELNLFGINVKGL